MKHITFVIPCYNSAATIERCVDSILPAGEAAEILIINDGSKDETGEIADRYSREHPAMVKSFHYENGGHGEAINRGLKLAEGRFFKVVDSDDYLDLNSLRTLMERLHTFEETGVFPDIIVADYVRVRQGTNRKRRMDYWSAFPQERPFTFADVRYLGCYQNLFIHALIYRTGVLRESGLVLPKHTFYVDALYATIPLFFVKTLYYLRVPLYNYVVGRPGQSVERVFMNKNIGQMLSIFWTKVDYYLANERPLEKKQRKLLLDDMSFVLTVISIHMMMAATPESLAKRHEIWRTLYARDPAFAKRMRRNLFGLFVSTPTERFNPMFVGIYDFINRVFIVD